MRLLFSEQDWIRTDEFIIPQRLFLSRANVLGKVMKLTGPVPPKLLDGKGGNMRDANKEMGSAPWKCKHENIQYTFPRSTTYKPWVFKALLVLVIVSNLH